MPAKKTRYVWIAFPTMNASGNLPNIFRDLKKLRKRLRDIGCVLEGVRFTVEPSKDNTLDLVRKFQAKAQNRDLIEVVENSVQMFNTKVRRMNEKWGVKRASKFCDQHGVSMSDCIFIEMDADGEMKLPQSEGMIEDWLIPGTFDMVVGNVTYLPWLLPEHELNTLLSLGKMQSDAGLADHPFSLQSPGYRVIWMSALERTLPYVEKYFEYFARQNHGEEVARWGYPGLFYMINAAAAAAEGDLGDRKLIHTMYTGCEGWASDATEARAARRKIQFEAGMQNILTMVSFRNFLGLAA
jgi:hypothetical protein